MSVRPDPSQFAGAQAFLDGRVVLHAGDCLDVLKAMPDAYFDAVVTDPPYALVSIVKRFGKAGSAPVKVPDGADGAYKRASAGFMGKAWDTGERAFAVEFWAEVLRVLKPGGHVAAFSGTRTYHRLAVAIEDAGFEIRDQLAWVYGSGFPKSHDVSKAIDKAKGAVRRVVAEGAPIKRMIPGADQHKSGWEKMDGRLFVPTETEAGSPEAAAWQGWGTALKPAWEPIVLARKPLIGTVADTVLEHGTGALNVDGCRVGDEGGTRAVGKGRDSAGVYGNGMNSPPSVQIDAGRWPANIAHDGSEEAVATFGGEQTSRFFYTAKADAHDGAGSGHPTVKPVDLMQWLCRLITPKGGRILDPFAGSGTTGEAAWREGFSCHLIEREADYQADIARRMNLADKGLATRKAESAKAKLARRGESVDLGPLFGGSDTPPATVEPSMASLPTKAGARKAQSHD